MCGHGESSEHGALDLASAGGRLHDHALVVGEGLLDRARELLGVLHLHDPDRGAEVGRLHEHRQAQALEHARPGLPIGGPVARRGQPQEVDLGDPGGAHQLFEEHLVEADGGGGHAGADVGDVERLEHPLDGAVLAEGAVERREGDVGREQPAAGRRAQQLAVTVPLALAGDLHPQDLVPAGLEAVAHRPPG